MKAIADITRDCLELPPAERLKLARILLDLSAPDQDPCPAADEAWEAEIGDRIRAVIGGTAESLPLVEALAELDRRFPA